MLQQCIAHGAVVPNTNAKVKRVEEDFAWGVGRRAECVHTLAKLSTKQNKNQQMCSCDVHSHAIGVPKPPLFVAAELAEGSQITELADFADVVRHIFSTIHIHFLLFQ